MVKRRRTLVAGVAAIVLLLTLGFAWSALKGGHRSSNDYAAFAACPVGDPRTDLCLFTQTTGGKFIIGSKTVPLSRTITLQGGIHVVKNSEREVIKDEFIAAAHGETIAKTSQALPGGLRGVVDPRLLGPASRKRFERLLAAGRTRVTATIELAAPAPAIGVSTQNLIEAKGIGLSLPLKVKLSNPFLGAGCQIGASADPIVVALTTGRIATRGPSRSPESIRGKPGHATFADHYNLVTLAASSLVSDSFAAPRAAGCGAPKDAREDAAIDAELSLPAGAGRNTAILEVTLRDANATAVRASK